MVTAALAKRSWRTTFARLAATGAVVNQAAGRAAATKVFKVVEQILDAASFRNNARRLAAGHAAVGAFDEVEEAFTRPTLEPRRGQTVRVDRQVPLALIKSLAISLGRLDGLRFELCGEPSATANGSGQRARQGSDR